MPNAYLIVSGTATDPEDGEIPGVYLVDVSDAAPANLVEETALEAFHLNIGIANVDDFDIRVVDGSGQPFPDQHVDPTAREEHPLEGWGEFQGSLNNADVPFEVEAADAPGP